MDQHGTDRVEQCDGSSSDHVAVLVPFHFSSVSCFRAERITYEDSMFDSIHYLCRCVHILVVVSTLRYQRYVVFERDSNTTNIVLSLLYARELRMSFVLLSKIVTKLYFRMLRKTNALEHRYHTDSLHLLFPRYRVRRSWT